MRVATGGVEEWHLVGAHLDLAEVGLDDLAVEAEGSEVGAGDGDPQWVALDATQAQASAGESHEVASDAAAQVDDGRDTGRRQSPGPRPGDRRAGGLLEGIRGEVHAGRVIAELAASLGPQLVLGDRRGDELGRMGTTQARAEREVRLGPGPGVDLDQQVLPGGGEQLLEGREVHCGDHSEERSDENERE